MKERHHPIVKSDYLTLSRLVLQLLAMHFNATVLSSGGTFTIVCLNCVMSIADYHTIVVHIYKENNKYSYTTQIFYSD
jgi:hypothetical protein